MFVRLLGEMRRHTTANAVTQRFWAFGLTLAIFAVQTRAQDSQPGFTIRARSELVTVNVTVKDQNGNFIRDLKREDFTVLEDNKPQSILSLDVESTDIVAQPPAEQVKLLAPAPTTAGNTAQPIPLDSFKNRRLIILFFDLSALQPDEVDRSAIAAENYVDKQMTTADVVAVVSLGNTLVVNQDFTADRVLLNKALHAFNSGTGQGFENGTTGTTEGTPDAGQPFTADDTEYNIFNTDRRLEALRSIAASLSKVDQKKSLIYFSSGMDRTGIENQSQLRAAVDAAVRSNLAIYTMDIRGLQAIVAGGEAQSASLRGTSAYSGAATTNQFNSNADSQETLVTLAGDTGGRAFLDSNDFGKVFTQVQQDTATYYMLSYHSSNPARDGRFRHITVRLKRNGVKLEYRKGYYAPADFKHSTTEDRERQLEDELASELPDTDLPVYLSTGYFRVSDGRFFVPVSLVVPGTEIPFTRNKDQDKATLDVIGLLTDDTKRPAGQVRDTVKLQLDASQEVRRKNVQYDTGFTLPSGKYHIKFVLRENETGHLGSFETDLVIPDLKAAPVKLSSVVLASQMQPAGKNKTENPLISNGSALIPNVTHVFSAAQHLYFHYEVYDPARASNGDGAKTQSSAPKSGIHVLTSVAFYQNAAKVYETQLVEARELSAPDRHAAVFQFDVPLGQLKPGFYTCQISVVDDAAAKFAFPRLTLLVRP